MPQSGAIMGVLTLVVTKWPDQYLVLIFFPFVSIPALCHCKFNGAHSCAHARIIIPLAPIHPFTKQMVPSLCPESLTRSLFRSFSPVLYVCLIKGFLSPKTFLRARCFFSLFVSLFHFHHTLFRGHAGACVNSESLFQTLFLCIHFFVK